MGTFPRGLHSAAMLRKFLCRQPAGLSWGAACTQNTKGGCTCMIWGILGALTPAKTPQWGGYFSVLLTENSGNVEFTPELPQGCDNENATLKHWIAWKSAWPLQLTWATTPHTASLLGFTHTDWWQRTAHCCAGRTLKRKTHVNAMLLSETWDKYKFSWWYWHLLEFWSHELKASINKCSHT